MKKGIIALLSVLALAFAFAGCSESDGGYSSATDEADNSSVETVTTTEDDVTATTVPNELGINSELGLPPELPGA